jgi:hypothetical protein
MTSFSSMSEKYFFLMRTSKDNANSNGMMPSRRSCKTSGGYPDVT